MCATTFPIPYLINSIQLLLVISSLLCVIGMPNNGANEEENRTKHLNKFNNIKYFNKSE